MKALIQFRFPFSFQNNQVQKHSDPKGRAGQSPFGFQALRWEEKKDPAGTSDL